MNAHTPSEVLASASAIDTFIANSPRLIQGVELDGWNGLDGTGFIADLEREDGTSLSIVVDVTDSAVTMSWYQQGITWGDEGWGWVKLSDMQQDALRTLTQEVE